MLHAPSEPARYNALVERALAWLEAAGAPQPPATLAQHVLGATGAAGMATFARLLDRLLEQDERFRRNGDGHWALATWDRTAVPLKEEEFAVIDVETTGGRTGRHRIIEVAAVKLRAGQVAGQFASLVNPGRPLPRFVIELTGITPELVEEAPSPAPVLEQLRAFIGDAVLVGHNIGCDLTFLNYEALWHGQAPFGNRALDTEELAAKLLPHLRKPSLDRVAAALGLVPPARHRALADARLAAQVLLRLLERLDRRQIGTVADLQAWLASRLVERQERVRRVRRVLPAAVIRSLPEQPGIYVFKDDAGRALYVGKAASLRDRVMQHFTGSALAARRHEGLLDRTASVEHTVAGCELEALLLEAERIRALRPPYNVQQRVRSGCPFVRIEPGPFPRVGPARIVEDGGAYAGPYRTGREVRHTVEMLRRVFLLRSCRRALPARRAALRVPCVRLGRQLCPAPCAGLVDEAQYGVLVELARLFLVQGKEATLAALDSRLATLERDGLAGSWEHAVLQLCRARLQRVRRVYRPIEGGYAGGALLMAYPGAEGGLLLFFVRNGRLLCRQRFAPGEVSLEPLARWIEELRAVPPDDPLGTAVPDDEANLVLRWLYRHTGRPELVPVPDGAASRDLAARVLALYGGMVALPDGPASLLPAS